MKDIKKRLLWLIGYYWNICLMMSFTIVSVWIYGSIIQFMQESNVAEWVIIFTQIILAITSIGILLKLAISKYKFLMKCLKENE